MHVLAYLSDQIFIKKDLNEAQPTVKFHTVTFSVKRAHTRSINMDFIKLPKEKSPNLVTLVRINRKICLVTVAFLEFPLRSLSSACIAVNDCSSQDAARL
jgi:hypothetical protein